MIITCPKCATRYEAQDDAFRPEGRKVKCSTCSHNWFQLPPELEVSNEMGPEEDYAADFQEAAGPVADVESEAAKLAAASRAASASFANQRARRQGNITGWATFAVFISVLVATAYFARVGIVKLVPASAQLYAQIGLPVNIRGLEFTNVQYLREFENGVPILSVSGEIVNVSAEAMHLPRLRFGLFDGEEHEIYHWTMAVARDPLEPTGSMRFSTRLAAPPDSAQHVQVRFVQGS